MLFWKQVFQRMLRLVIASEYYVSELALVARDNDEIVGYSLLSECFLEDERVLVLAPVAVKPGVAEPRCRESVDRSWHFQSEENRIPLY